MSKKHNMMALVLDGALRGYLTPRLAEDAGLDLAPIVKGVTHKNYTQSKDRIKNALVDATKNKLAQDADINDVDEVLDNLDETAAAHDEEPDDLPSPHTDPDDDSGDDAYSRLMSILSGKLSDEEMQQVHSLIDDLSDDDDDADSDDDNPPVGDKKTVPPTITRAAMDAAISVAVTKAEREMVARQRAIREAERAVAPFVGEVTVAMDSAEEVYRLALDSAKVDLKGVPPAAYAAMVKMLPRPGSPKPHFGPAAVAMDQAAESDFEKKFGKISHIKRR